MSIRNTLIVELNFRLKSDPDFRYKSLLKFLDSDRKMYARDYYIRNKDRIKRRNAQ